MTNKLPVVGKRQTLEEVLDKCDNPDLWTPSQIICFISDYLDGSIGGGLPEDKQDTKKNLVTELSKEVLEAMEELRDAINYPLEDDPINTAQEEISYKADILLNALDNQFKRSNEPSNEKASDYVTDKNVGEIKPKESIWKPVSE